ncbi:MAG: rhomboid family intramembrane serine protease [Actinobacteria bacterium]|nr:MAG: rhomboid family intramembrane serine protease [Actinomycetota bacterium]
MTPAPVGFQCPECVRAGSQQSKLTVLRPGTPVGAGAGAGKPYATWTIVGINVAVFVVELLLGVNAVAGQFGMYPVALGLGGEWFRLPASMFLHGSILHLLFNMYVLVVLGPTLERILGHVRFVVLYLVAGVGGAVASYAFSSPMTVSVGASGAIFGLMGALLVAGQRLRFDIKTILVLVGINLAIGFVVGGIDWRAHLGGLITGAALAAVMVSPAGRPRKVVEYGGIAAVLLVLVAVTAFRTGQIQGMLG